MKLEEDILAEAMHFAPLYDSFLAFENVIDSSSPYPKIDSIFSLAPSCVY